jgi:hypothetical protein
MAKGGTEGREDKCQNASPIECDKDGEICGFKAIYRRSTETDGSQI